MTRWLLLVASAAADSSGYISWASRDVPGRRIQHQQPALASPYRFDIGRYTCAVEGQLCACDGNVTFHGAPQAVPPPGVPSTDRPVPTVPCSRKLTFAPEHFYSSRHVNGTCVCHPRDATSTQPSPLPARNLLLVDSVGSCEKRLRTVEANVKMHFKGRDWDCIVAVYADDTTMPRSRLEALSEVCTIFRAPLEWGAFLTTLTPSVVQHYDRVAVLLDDADLNRVRVASLIAEMAAKNVDVISPAVVGAHHHGAMIMNVSAPNARRCLRETHFIEIYFTIFTRDAWGCFYTRLLQDFNPGGCGYDVCLHQACPMLRFAVDYRHVAAHREPAECNLHTPGQKLNRAATKEGALESKGRRLSGQTGNTCTYSFFIAKCGHVPNPPNLGCMWRWPTPNHAASANAAALRAHPPRPRRQPQAVAKLIRPANEKSPPPPPREGGAAP